MRKIALYSFIIFISTMFSLGFAENCMAAVNSSSKKTASATSKIKAQPTLKKITIAQPQPSTKVSNSNQSQATIKNSNTQEKQVPAKATVKHLQEVLIIDKPSGQLQGYGIAADGTVTLNNKHFAYLNFDIEENPRKYGGQKVDIIGFVERLPGFKENEFKVARIELSRCGSKDNTFIGLVCQTENASDFKTGEWVRVKGNLVVRISKDQVTSFELEDFYIVPESIERVPKQDDVVY